MQQVEALEILKLGYNVFLTGAAGAGKTYVLNSYIDYLKDHGVDVAVTASTGIAATHISGQTIHSWCGFGTREALTENDLENIATDRRLRASIGKAKVLVIDEVSMLHARQLEMVEIVTRKVRGGGEPFGGLQVVLCGDFFQLPPVTRNEEREKFAFHSNAWRNGNFVVCYLLEQHRQRSDPLLSVLNDIRSGNTGEHTKVPLRTRYKKTPVDAQGSPFEPTLLFARNVNVDALNDAALSRLQGETHRFTMTSRGFKGHVDALKRSCLAPEELSLKIGAQVMFVKNSTEQLYVNGTRGVVESFDPVDGWPEVRTLDGALICAEPDEWTFEESGVARASILQVPLRLAWAITIHKSQGMTLDAAEVDLSDAFEPGMGYVALSRVRTLNGLKLMGLNEMALRVHPDVLAKDHELRAHSADAQRLLASIPPPEREEKGLATLLQRFRGRVAASPQTRKEKKAPVRRERAPATHIITRDLLAAGATVEAIAQGRGLSVGTVVHHLEKLKGDGEMPDIEHLRAGIPETDFDSVLKELQSSEDGKLKPVWEKFDGRLSYELIRVIRLFA